MEEAQTDQIFERGVAEKEEVSLLGECWTSKLFSSSYPSLKKSTWRAQGARGLPFFLWKYLRSFWAFQPERVVQWIRECISTPRFYSCINGELNGGGWDRARGRDGRPLLLNLFFPFFHFAVEAIPCFVFSVMSGATFLRCLIIFRLHSSGSWEFKFEHYSPVENLPIFEISMSWIKMNIERWAGKLRKPNRSDLKAHSHPPSWNSTTPYFISAGAHEELLEQSLRVSDAPP